MSEITLIAVTKTVGLAEIEKISSLGILDLGENRIQPALDKICSFTSSPVTWHLIGHLQTNKVRQAVQYFQLIHSVDSLKLAKAIDAEAEKQHKKMTVLLQVNISGEITKHGFTPEGLMQTLPDLGRLKNIEIKGLMTMAPHYDDPETARPVFRGMRELTMTITRDMVPGISLQYLSMGMSNDFEVAIEEGATHIRVGSALFND